MSASGTKMRGPQTEATSAGDSNDNRHDIARRSGDILMMDETRRRVGRPPKYDWGDKRDICYKLYVEEQRSAAEIAQYFAQHFNVNPSELPCRKGFLRQFQAWGFPSHTKKLSTEDEALVLARVKELWEQNVNQKDIKRTLAEDGWELKDYQFTKLWKKNGLRLRNEQGYKAPDPARKKKRKRSEITPDDGADAQDGLMLDLAQAAAAAGGGGGGGGGGDDDESDGPIAPSMHPDDAAARAQRLMEIQIESDQKLQARKRRRRIRGYGHLPPDAPGTAPRYASETSLDECKAYLQLSNEMYNTIRQDYTAICEEMGIIKKTQCAEGVWEGSKDRLVQENLHLSAMMHPLQPDQDMKKVALDCLCADVTKRMRVAGKSITIAEANNLLGLNPTESKAIRRSMYEILAAENFESRLVCGETQWRALRQRWFDANAKLQDAVDENDHFKLKAVDLLCSDAMKRFREDKNKRGERAVVQRNAKYGPGPGPAWAATAPRSKTGAEEKAARQGGGSKSDGVVRTTIREPTVRAIMHNTSYPAQESGNLISTLAQATGTIDFDSTALDPLLAARPSSPPPLTPAPRSLPIPAYFRLSPQSTLTGHHPKMWLGKLAAVSITALRQAATCKAGAARVGKIHGVVKGEDGTEDGWLIETVEELEAYLEEAGEKASFIALLEGGYA